MPNSPERTTGRSQSDAPRTGALTRLRRIEGQVRGLQRMVEEGRDSMEVLTQMAAVREALRSTGKVLLLAEVKTGMAGACDACDRDGALEVAEAALDLAFRHGR